MSQKGKFLNLHPHMESWAIYNVDGPYTTAHKIGTLAPAQYGGLSYMILDEKGGDIYIIQTESFGQCAIWAPQDNDSNITYERTYSNGDNHGSGGGTLVSRTGKYLNLKPHMQSWAVYNVSGPYTTAHKIGTLAPAQYGGLSYQILEEKGGDVYIIQTESFGKCAIWAPRDNDSSISNAPEYTNGGSSSSVSSEITSENGGVELPGGLKVFIDPGHGGNDPGALGSTFNEKDIVLAISKKLGVILNSYGVSVKYSRENDTAVGLEERAQMANNWGASLFVSIHANSAASPASGTECFTKPSANSSTKQLSANIAKSISSKLGIANRGHKEEVWRVLTSSNIPAILVETAFVNHPNDSNLLLNRQDDFADAIAREILNYLNINSTKNNELEQINNNGFAKEFGVEFSDTEEEILILQSGPLKISLEATSNNTFGDSPIVVNIENGELVGGTLKTDFIDFGLKLADKFEISLEKLLLELGSKSISVSTSKTSNTTTISFIYTDELNDTSSIKQILKIEFDENKAQQTAEEIKAALEPVLEFTVKVAKAVLVVASVILCILLAVEIFVAGGVSALITYFTSLFLTLK